MWVSPDDEALTYQIFWTYVQCFLKSVLMLTVWRNICATSVRTRLTIHTLLLMILKDNLPHVTDTESIHVRRQL